IPGRDSLYLTATRRMTETVTVETKALIAVSIPHEPRIIYMIAPDKQAVAYISFRKINGVSFINVSRITPPMTAENTPRITAAVCVLSYVRDFCTPTTQKKPIPKASKKVKVLAKRYNCLFATIEII